MSKMKKVIAVIICSLIVAGLAAALRMKIFFIGRKEAVNIALTESGLTEADTVGMTRRLDWDKGMFLYEVEFYSDGVEYEYTIHALDGFVLKVETIGAGYTPAGGRPGNEYRDWKQDTQKPDWENRELISREEAERIALSDAQPDTEEPINLITTVDSESNAFVVEFSTEEILYTYKVSIISGQGIKEKRLEFLNTDINVPDEEENEDNARDGEENTDNADNEDELPVQGPFSNRQAKKVALDDIGIIEAQARRVRAIADTLDGNRVYNVEVYTDNIYYQYLVRGEDGKILVIDISYLNVM